MDRVYVRTNPNFKTQQTIQISGEVSFQAFIRFWKTMRHCDRS